MRMEWNKGICHYAGLDLTYQKEKFPALVDVARHFATIYEREFEGYLAGI